MSVLEYIKDIFNNPARYAKFWVALATAIVNMLVVTFPDAPWLAVVINFAGAIGVFVTPNVNNKIRSK